jgi:hypothetical protein
LNGRGASLHSAACWNAYGLEKNPFVKTTKKDDKPFSLADKFRL